MRYCLILLSGSKIIIKRKSIIIGRFHNRIHWTFILKHRCKQVHQVHGLWFSALAYFSCLVSKKFNSRLHKYQSTLHDQILHSMVRQSIQKRIYRFLYLALQETNDVRLTKSYYEDERGDKLVEQVQSLTWVQVGTHSSWMTSETSSPFPSPRERAQVNHNTSSVFPNFSARAFSFSIAAGHLVHLVCQKSITPTRPLHISGRVVMVFSCACTGELLGLRSKRTGRDGSIFWRDELRGLLCSAI